MPQTGPDHFYYTLKSEQQNVLSAGASQAGGRPAKRQRTKLSGRPSKRVKASNGAIRLREEETLLELQLEPAFKCKRYKSGKCRRY
jgi:hypothetical protein